jgi:hypothetical protein
MSKELDKEFREINERLKRVDRVTKRVKLFEEYEEILKRCLDLNDFSGLADLIIDYKGHLYLCWVHKTFHPNNECPEYHQILTSIETLDAKLPEVKIWADIWLTKLRDLR